MANKGYIPVEAVRARLAAIDARLLELDQESMRIRNEAELLAANRSVLLELEQAVVLDAKENKAANEPGGAIESGLQKPRPYSQAIQIPEIPDGRVATPIIFQLIRARPGIKSVEVIDAMHGHVTKQGKSPRKFLGDLIWELGHRNKIRREPDGSLYLVEQGGGT